MNTRFTVQLRTGCSALVFGIACLILTERCPAQPSTKPLARFWQPNGPVYCLLVTNSVVYLGGQFGYVGPASGGAGVVALDTDRVKRGFPTVEGVVTAAAPDGSGGWYIGGTFSAVGGVVRTNLARVCSDNTVDPLWNPGPNDTVSVVTVAGNRIYVGGGFTRIGGQTRNHVAALDPATGEALVWNPNANDWVRAIAVEGNRVYVGGEFTRMGSATRNRIAAVDATTGSVLSWNPNANNVVNSLLAVGDAVYVGGLFTSIGTKPRNRIAALEAGTGVATAWNPNANAQVSSLAAAGGIVYAGGLFTSIGAQTRNRIAALDSTTGLATAWDADANDDVLALALAGGKLYVGGRFTTIGGAERVALASLDLDTGAAQPWHPIVLNQDGTSPRVSVLAAEGNELLAGGEFLSIGGIRRRNAAALDLATGEATEWNPDASGLVCALGFGDDRVYVGGSFTNVGGATRSRLAAVDATNGLVLGWDPVVLGKNAKVSAILVVTNRILVGGNFTGIGSVVRNGLASINLAGEAVEWDPNVGGTSAGTAGTVNAMALGANVLFIGGEFATVGGKARQRLAAVNLVSGSPTDWAPRAENTVYALALAGTTLYVGGTFTEVGGQVRNRIASLDAETAKTSVWNPDASGTTSPSVVALAAVANTVYAGGSFTAIGGEFRNRLATLSAAAGQCGTWNPNPNALVRAFVITPDGIYVGGDFTKVGGKAQYYFAAFPIETGFLADSVKMTADGSFESAVEVGDGQRLIIQASSDLVRWDDVSTNTPAGSAILFKDRTGGTVPHRFYRALLEQ
jgi:hypothetical protein